MANCHALFLSFNSTISLTNSKKKTLRRSRNAVREKIKAYFKDKQNGLSPKFHGQGSFMMNTIIKPINGEFDIDDGIYFEVDAEPSQNVTTLHKWICDSINGHTKEEPIDRNTCVRLIYASQYHIDLPIYYVVKGQTPYLAHKSKGWIKSDPKEFIKWFNNKIDDDGQLKRIIRYLKAWSDYRKGELPSGLVFSILASNNIKFNDRDDLALYHTILNIKNRLEFDFSCYRPTTPNNENLLNDYSKTKKNYFLNQLNSFSQYAKKACEDETSPEDACLEWQRIFGDSRFVSGLTDEEKSNLTNNSSIFSSQNESGLITYSNTEEFIENLFPVDLQYQLKIDCKVSQDGFRVQLLNNLLSSRLPLHRNKKLEFFIVNHNIPKPFIVKWKVRNHGQEAIKRNQIRGQIRDDDGDHKIVEHSNFYGGHFVECYIIKDNTCVAISTIEVPISKHIET